MIENQKPVLGVIFVPVSGGLYFSTSISNSISTSGAFKVKVDLSNFSVNDLIVKAQKLPLPSADKTFTILASRSHSSKETEAYIDTMREKHGNINVISKGSSLKFCIIAEGQADCYPKFGPTMEWDTAAGQAICEQSGIEVMNLETQKTIMYNRRDLLNPSFLVQKQKTV